MSNCPQDPIPPLPISEPTDDPIPPLPISEPTDNSYLRDHKQDVIGEIRSRLWELDQKLPSYQRKTSETRYLIQYFLSEKLLTVDELVKGVSDIAWGKPTCSEILAKLLKELYDGPHQSEDIKSFVNTFFSDAVRKISTALLANVLLGKTISPDVEYAVVFVGHLTALGLLSPQLVEFHLIRPLTLDNDGEPKIGIDGNACTLWCSNKTSRNMLLWKLFSAAGEQLVQGILKTEDVKICMDIFEEERAKNDKLQVACYSQ